MKRIQLRLIRLLGLAICGGTFAATWFVGRPDPFKYFANRMFDPFTLICGLGICVGSFLIALSLQIPKGDGRRNIDGNNL